MKTKNLTKAEKIKKLERSIRKFGDSTGQKKEALNDLRRK